ncbi:procyclic acidic repetitive family protein [Candidatus Parcubacteria bacterium]|nr:procyclic acidic repetitive family protein [Candidatus Parcubacteria bacterium]
MILKRFLTLTVIVLSSTPLFASAQNLSLAPNLDLKYIESAVESVGSSVHLPQTVYREVIPNAKEDALRRFVGNVTKGFTNAKRTAQTLAKTIDYWRSEGEVINASAAEVASSIPKIKIIDAGEIALAVVDLAAETRSLSSAVELPNLSSVQPKPTVSKTVSKKESAGSVVSSVVNAARETIRIAEGPLVQKAEEVAAPVIAQRSFLDIFKRQSPAPTVTPVTAPIIAAPSTAASREVANIQNKVTNLESVVSMIRSILTRQNDSSADRIGDTITNTITNTVINNFAVTTGAFSSNVSISGILSLLGATTTAVNGIDISGGCFAINGVCLSTSSGGGSAAGNSKFATSTNGFALFPSGGTSMALVLGGSATTTTGPLLEVLGAFYTSGSSTLQNFTFRNATGTSATTTNFFATTASSTNLFSSLLTIGNNALVVNSLGNVGIGTSTQRWALQVASSTGPQITISDSGSAAFNHWSFRNAGGSLFLATSSPSTFATSSHTALSIIGSTAYVGIGTTTPGSKLSVAGGVSIGPNFGTAAPTGSGLNVEGNVGIGTQSPSTGSGATSFIHISNTSAAIRLQSASPGDSYELVSTQVSSAPFFGINDTFFGNYAFNIRNNNIGIGIGTVASLSGVGIGKGLAVGSFATLNAAATGTIITSFNLGVGTATPQWVGQFASSTRPQLALSDPSSLSLNHWTFRNSGGLLYLATSSPSTFATSTVPALIIDLNGLLDFKALRSTTTNATTTNLFSTIASTTSLFAATFNTGTITTVGLGTLANLLSSGSSTLQNFTFTTATGTSATTTNFFSTLASTTNLFAAAATIGNNLSFTNNATTTIATSATGANWVIASTTNTLAIPLLAFSANGATSTISLFGATTTGLTAGTGVGLPAALKNMLIVGNGKDQAHVAIVNGSLCLDNDGWCTASTTAGRLTALGEQITASDLAEAYNSAEHLETGDVVSSAGGLTVTIATQANQSRMMGVVSTDPGIVLGLSTDENLSTPGKFPIALSGRIPTKVNTENGEIIVGDYLTLSSVPGVAAKALKAGVVIGQALDNYSGTGTGKIEVFVKNSYYSGIAVDKLPGLSGIGSLPDSKQVLASLMSGSLVTAGFVSEISTDRILAGIEIITPKLTANLVYANTIESPTLDALVARVGALESASATPLSSGSILGTITEWIGQKITAALGIFNRVEVGTAHVSQGIELIDSATGSTYCLTIKNGEWDKFQGACGSAPASPSPEPEPETVSEPEPVPEVAPEPETVSEPDPEPAPESAPEPAPEVATDPTPAP